MSAWFVTTRGGVALAREVDGVARFDLPRHVAHGMVDAAPAAVVGEACEIVADGPTVALASEDDAWNACDYWDGAGAWPVREAQACAVCGTVTRYRTAPNVCVACSDGVIETCGTYGCTTSGPTAPTVALGALVARSGLSPERIEAWHVVTDAMARDDTPHVVWSRVTGACYTRMMVTMDGPRCEDHAYMCDACGSIWGHEDGAIECCPSGCGECGYPDDECECGGDGVVHDYGYRPSPHFHFVYRDEDGPRVKWAWSPIDPTVRMPFGIELELEKARQGADRFLHMASEIYGDETFVYLKRDGSLCTEGVELVTHPASIDAFAMRFPWNALDLWQEDGARSYGYESCGMHVHMSRAAFTGPGHMWRFLTMHARCRTEVLRVGQRDECNWAKWGAPGRIDGKRYADLVTGKAHASDRYTALNMTGRATIEARYFKGNMTRASIMRKVGMLDAMHVYTRDMTVRDANDGALTWRAFARFVCGPDARPEWSALADYMTK